MSHILSSDGRPGGLSIVKNDHLGRPGLPSTHQIGEDVLIPATIYAITFTDGGVYYDVETGTGQKIELLDGRDAKTAPFVPVPQKGAA